MYESQELPPAKRLSAAAACEVDVPGWAAALVLAPELLASGCAVTPALLVTTLVVALTPALMSAALAAMVSALVVTTSMLSG